MRRLIIKDPFSRPDLKLASGDMISRAHALEDLATLMRLLENAHADPYRFQPRAVVARRFRVYLALHGINAPYRLTVAPPGGPSREVTVEGLAVNNQFRAWPSIAPRPNVVEVKLPPAPPTVFKPIQLENDFFQYRMIEPDIAYMNFFSTLSGVSTSSRFRKAVAAMFPVVAKDRPRVLVIDIRENGGGEGVASELLRHLTEKPFRFLESTQIKRSDIRRSFDPVLERAKNCPARTIR